MDDRYVGQHKPWKLIRDFDDLNPEVVQLVCELVVVLGDGLEYASFVSRFCSACWRMKSSSSPSAGWRPSRASKPLINRWSRVNLPTIPGSALS